MRARGILVAAATTLALAGGGCFAPPEACNECRAPGSDAATDGLGAAGHFGTGGTVGIGGSPGNGGAPGTGGTTGAGGSTGTGGMVVVGTGGSTMGTGGVVGTGGMVVVGTGGTMGTGGVVGTGGTVGTGGSGGTIDVALVDWYQMDETSGTTAADSSGHGRTAALMAMNGGTAAFSTTHKVGTGALNLTSTSATLGGFAIVPASLQTMGATTEITIACWVNVRNARLWERVFDFGSSSTGAYMFLTTHEQQTTPNAPRFAITTSGNAGEQAINMTTPAALSLNTWHHLAVVLAAGTPTYTGTLYIDKVAVGSNTAMTLRPSSLASTTNNWIGRSQFAVDPLFDGLIDDFRIYSRALTATEIAALP
jgi:hypothetical protein